MLAAVLLALSVGVLLWLQRNPAEIVIFAFFVTFGGWYIVQHVCNARAWKRRIEAAVLTSDDLVHALQTALMRPQLPRSGLRASLFVWATLDDRCWGQVVRVAAERDLFEVEPWEDRAEPQLLEVPAQQVWLGPVCIVGMYLLILLFTTPVPDGVHAVFGGASALSIAYTYLLTAGIGTQRYAVPGGLAIRQPSGASARVDYRQAADSNLLLVSTADAWHVLIASREGDVCRFVLSGSEADQLLAAWCSDVASPPAEWLSDLGQIVRRE